MCLGKRRGVRGDAVDLVSGTVLDEVSAQESGWGCFSSKLSNILGCPGEVAELISSEPGTESASQLSSSYVKLQRGHEVRHVLFELLPGQQLNTDFR